jgi:hypothetical protein
VRAAECVAASREYTIAPGRSGAWVVPAFDRWPAELAGGARNRALRERLLWCCEPERQRRRSDHSARHKRLGRRRRTQTKNHSDEMAYHGYAARPPRPPPPPAPYHRQQQPNGYARAAPASTNGYRTQPKDRPPVRRTTNGTQPRKQRRGQGSLERRREARAAARAAVASGSQLSANASIINHKITRGAGRRIGRPPLFARSWSTTASLL